MTEHEHGEKVVKIKIPRLNFWKVSTITLAIFLIVAVYTGGFGAGNKITGSAGFGITGKAVDVPGPDQVVPKPTIYTGISVDDDPLRGDENAELYLIEFSEYQCPFCVRFVKNSLPEIEENYIDTGKVKHVFRDFPLGFHPYAEPAAIATECADEQGKFWEYHDLLFENQALLSEDKWEEWAEEVGLDADDFAECLEDEAIAKEVADDLADGKKYGITGTPSFFIGNDDVGYVKIVGAQPYEVFEAVFEEMLA